MLLVENYLLQSVRQAIIDANIAREEECDIEIDDQCPAVAGDKYLAISADSASLGQWKNVNGAVDVQFGVRVAAFQRVTAIPRDRRRMIYSSLLIELNKRLDDVIQLLHQNWPMKCELNETLADAGIDGQFVHPLALHKIDARPRIATAAEYAAHFAGKGENVVALVRGIGFGGARFIGGAA